MREQPLILVVDDMPDNVEIAKLRLEKEGYAVATAVDGEQALAAIRELSPDLVLLDVMMPGLDGIEVTRRVKADASLPFVPIVLLTAKAATKDVVAGLDAGADDYLAKPFEHAALVARVRAMLRIKALHDSVEGHKRELAALNAGLEARVAEQVGEIERVGRLRRFLPPQLAEMLAGGDEKALDTHRRDIVVLFCDLRGFTAFAESAEPEDLMAVLRAYHEAMGPLVHRFEGTLDRFMGDGLMAFFNDPVPCPDAPERAVKLAVAMRDAARDLAEGWRRTGHRLGLGIGIAQGYATLGRIGFAERSDYSAIGNVTNVAARLCAEAIDGQILVTQRVATAAEALALCEPIGELTLKGLARPVAAFNVAGLR